MCPSRAPVVIAVAATVVAMLAVPPAVADPSPVRVAYRPPVPGPVVDPYRPPSTPYGPGNRGIDYATTPGEAVVAPADGEVTFAGAVGGGLHVVLFHLDGIRTSLSFLGDVLVRRGQLVTGGAPVGRAAATLHFGARRGEAYLDPATLLGGGGSGGRAVLVPEGPGRPLGAGDEAAGLRRLLAGDQPVAQPAAPAAATAKAARPVGWNRRPGVGGHSVGGPARPGRSAGGARPAGNDRRQPPGRGYDVRLALRPGAPPPTFSVTHAAAGSPRSRQSWRAPPAVEHNRGRTRWPSSP